MEKHMEKSMWSKRNAWLIFSHILYDAINGIKKYEKNHGKAKWPRRKVGGGGGGGASVPPLDI